jgi:thioester reductase-like protein
MSCSPEPDSLVAESAEFRERAEHLVEYTHSKSTIEQLMQQHCPTLPLVIARPSIVVGHTHHGCRPSSSIFWVFSMGLMLQKFMFHGGPNRCYPGGLLRRRPADAA